MDLFDTHFHLPHDEDHGGLIAGARDRGVTSLLLAAGNADDTRRGLALTGETGRLWCTAGLHPHEAATYGGDLAPFRDLAAHPGVVAIGEIGLDYHYDFSPRKTQRRVFAAFLELAVSKCLPVVVHCREAHEDCVAILADCLPPGHPRNVHSFTGTLEQAQELLETGAFLSFNGMLTFKRADNIRESFAVVPLDRVLIETDSPYLAPVPLRGKPNRPEYLVHIAAKGAELRQMSLDAFARATTANGCRFFDVPRPPRQGSTAQVHAGPSASAGNDS